MKQLHKTGIDEAVEGLALVLAAGDDWAEVQWVKDHFVTEFEYGDEAENLAGEVEDLFEAVANEFYLCRVALTQSVEDKLRESGILPESLY